MDLVDQPTVEHHADPDFLPHEEATDCDPHHMPEPNELDLVKVKDELAAALPRLQSALVPMRLDRVRHLRERVRREHDELSGPLQASLKQARAAPSTNCRASSGRVLPSKTASPSREYGTTIVSWSKSYMSHALGSSHKAPSGHRSSSLGRGSQWPTARPKLWSTASRETESSCELDARRGCSTRRKPLPRARSRALSAAAAPETNSSEAAGRRRLGARYRGRPRQSSPSSARRRRGNGEPWRSSAAMTAAVVVATRPTATRRSRPGPLLFSAAHSCKSFACTRSAVVQIAVDACTDKRHALARHEQRAIADDVRRHDLLEPVEGHVGVAPVGLHDDGRRSPRSQERQKRARLLPHPCGFVLVDTPRGVQSLAMHDGNFAALANGTTV